MWRENCVNITLTVFCPLFMQKNDHHLKKKLWEYLKIFKANLSIQTMVRHWRFRSIHLRLDFVN